MRKFAALPLPIFLGARFGTISGEHFMEKMLQKYWPKYNNLSDLHKDLLVKGVGGTAIATPIYLGGGALWNKMFPEAVDAEEKEKVENTLKSILQENSANLI